MPFISAIPPPVDAPRNVLALCESAQDALRVSLRSKRFSQRKYASLLGISHTMVGYMCRGARPIPAELVDRICAVTGTNLLKQWLRLQRALDEPTEADRIERIARELRAA